MDMYVTERKWVASGLVTQFVGYLSTDSDKGWTGGLWAITDILIPNSKVGGILHDITSTLNFKGTVAI